MTTEEVAKKVVELVRKQAWYEALDTLYDNDIVSVEATAPVSRGKEEVRGSRLVGQRDAGSQLRCKRTICRS
jgi:hypothetical protein